MGTLEEKLHRRHGILQRLKLSQMEVSLNHDGYLLLHTVTRTVILGNTHILCSLQWHAVALPAHSTRTGVFATCC